MSKWERERVGGGAVDEKRLQEERPACVKVQGPKITL